MQQKIKETKNFAIVVENLCKNYGNFPALKNVNFTIEKGEIVGFLGPNGAGKTTTMNILTGCISYGIGKVNIYGCDIFKEPLKAKKNVGYLPENPPLYHNMTVFEYLKFVCEIKKVSKVKNEIKRVVELCGLQNKEAKLISSLSKGFKQRVGIAQALIGSPKILILDEPTSGLDPAQIVQVRSLILSLKKEHTIILSTHILSEIQAVCDRIIIINEGKIVANNTEENLLKKTENFLNFQVEANSKEEILKALEGVQDLIELKDFKQKEGLIEFRLTFKKSNEIHDFEEIRRKISRILMENKIPILKLNFEEFSLEELFINLIEKKEVELKV